MVQRLRRRGENTKSELRLVVNNVRRQDLVAIVNVILVFLGSPCQTKGFQFCFKPVLALFWSLWKSQVLHFRSPGAPFWHPWGSPGLHFGSSGRLLSAVGGTLLTPAGTG